MEFHGTKAARQQRGLLGQYTWHHDGINSLVIALDERSEGTIEDGTKI